MNRGAHGDSPLILAPLGVLNGKPPPQTSVRTLGGGSTSRPMREACWYRRLISHMVPIALVGVLVAHGFLALLPMRGEMPVRIRLGTL